MAEETKISKSRKVKKTIEFAGGSEVLNRETREAREHKGKLRSCASADDAGGVQVFSRSFQNEGRNHPASHIIINGVRPRCSNKAKK